MPFFLSFCIAFTVSAWLAFRSHASLCLFFLSFCIAFTDMEGVLLCYFNAHLEKFGSTPLQPRTNRLNYITFFKKLHL